MIQIPMRSVTAVNISILKRVRFILGRDITIQVRVDLSVVTHSQEENLIRSVLIFILIAQITLLSMWIRVGIVFGIIYLIL